MATSAEYSSWLAKNSKKAGSEEYDTVLQAYEIAKGNENAARFEQTRPQRTQDRGLVQQILGAGETALTLGTAATGGLFGTVGGAISEAYEQARAGRLGTREAARAIEQRAAAGAQRFTYEPRTEAGQEQVQALSSIAQFLPPVLPGALPVGMFGQTTRQAMPIVEATTLRGIEATGQAGRKAVETGRRVVTSVGESLGLETPEQRLGRGSVGAAATPAGLQREATAQGLPVPVQLTLGAREREAGQLAFEKEQIKGPQGAPLRERLEQNNLQILQNFDSLIDMTGSQTAAIGPAATGNAVIDALSKGWQAAKAKTAAAYKKADNSEEAFSPIDLTLPRALKIGDEETQTTLIDYLNNKPTGVPSSAIPDTAKQYAVLLGIASKDENGNLVPLPTNVKTLEQLRREINASTDYDPVNKREASILKSIIDATTDEAAGPLYKEARALREKQARKYEGRAVVANLLTTVRGKDDPKVAASEAFQKSILNATPEEVTFLRRVLLTSGEDGRKAFKELQGATVKHLQDVATSGMQTDSMGNPIISTAKLNNAVNAFDADGRLDIILGKQRAQIVRDLNEVVKYVNTVPPGTLVNSSGTSMALMGAIAEAGATGAITGIPLPALSLIRAASNKIKDNKVKARINQALNKASAGQPQE